MQKQQEAVPYEQSRQPRRGGTGGDGTIRRKRRRRLRWSSPPGQVEQVPRGFSSPLPPLGHHSGRDSQRRHAGTQAKAGTGRERRLPPIIIRSRKVLGGVGDSFKSPPAHPRIPVSHYPRQARRRRARMQKPAVRQAAGRRTATATPQRAEEGRERDREEPSMQTGVTEENSEVKVSLI